MSIKNRTHIPEYLKELEKIPRSTYRKYRPEFKNPKRLLDKCCEVSENLNQEFLDWTPEEVADWVAYELGYPELREVFIKNKIGTNQLTLLEADKCPRVNIKWFHIIKDLCANFRKLLKFEVEHFNRSISLPPKHPTTMYHIFKATRTGPTSFFMTPCKYFKKIKIIREEISEAWKFYELENHFNRIPPYMPWCPKLMIGGKRRVNPMTGTTLRQVNSVWYKYIPERSQF